jgi:hypothetical protein
MSEQQDNMAPGQQNYPNPDENVITPIAKPAEEIRSGAQQEDQLDELKANAPDDNSGKQVGAEPTAYQYERQTEDKESTEE